MHLVTRKNGQHVKFMNEQRVFRVGSLSSVFKLGMSSLIHIPIDGNGNLLLEHKSQPAFVGDFNNIHPYYSRDCGKVYQYKMTSHPTHTGFINVFSFFFVCYK